MLLEDFKVFALKLLPFLLKEPHEVSRDINAKVVDFDIYF
jgi:hypothetical protein